MRKINTKTAIEASVREPSFFASCPAFCKVLLTVILLTAVISFDEQEYYRQKRKGGLHDKKEKAEGTDMGHYVYKYVLNEEIIYIGKCDKNLDQRLKAHGRKGDNIPSQAWNDINKADIYYINLPNATMSDVVESELINRYKPKYNRAKISEWDGIPFVEPSWHKYKPPHKSPKKSVVGKGKALVDYRNHNKTAIEIINKILHKICDRNYQMWEGFYVIDVTEIIKDPNTFFRDITVKCNTGTRIARCTLCGSLDVDYGQICTTIYAKTLKEMILETDDIVFSEEAKFF